MSFHTRASGDSMTLHVGQKFRTQYQDNNASRGSCGVNYRGGWLYDNCHYSNLNGVYRRGANTSLYADGVEWWHWKGNH